MKYKNFLALLAVAILAASCTKKDSAKNNLSMEEMKACPSGVADVTDLKTEDLKSGDGAEAVNGKTVTVHYTGCLTNGTKFDSSLDRSEPFSLQLGSGMVIQGWEEGLQGMKVGGVRRLVIPSSKGYGERGAGNTIPPNATLVFTVSLEKVE